MGAIVLNEASDCFCRHYWLASRHRQRPKGRRILSGAPDRDVNFAVRWLIYRVPVTG